MLSQKCKYAIRAILYIAAESDSENKLKGGAEIAEHLKIPFYFTSKILQELARKKIVSSVKGPNGGFYLSDQNKKLPLIELVNAIDDVSYFTSCGLGLVECSEQHPCPIHDAFKLSRDSLLVLFKTKTLGELGHQVKVNNFFLKCS